MLKSLVPFCASFFILPLFANAESWTDCKSAREYITTLEYLKGHPALGLDQVQTRSVAEKVSNGCTGAARRFVRVFETLEKFEVGTRDAIEHAISFSRQSDARTDSFLYTLKTAFLREGLDMDLASSLKMAHSLSDEYDGPIEKAEHDFKQLVAFCKSDSGMGLPPPQCGPVAARITRLGQGFKKRVAPGFIRAFDFMREEKTINASIPDALKWSEDIVATAPDAADNFIIAYKYGVRSNGLDLAAKDGMQFARRIASQTVEPDAEDARQPASVPAKTDKTSHHQE